jgi:hypothetical protein
MSPFVRTKKYCHKQMKTLGAIIRMCYGIGWLLCIVALFFPEGNVFRELAIYILLTVSVFNWYKEYKSKKKE